MYKQTPPNRALDLKNRFTAVFYIFMYGAISASPKKRGLQLRVLIQSGRSDFDAINGRPHQNRKNAQIILSMTGGTLE